MSNSDKHKAHASQGASLMTPETKQNWNQGLAENLVGGKQQKTLFPAQKTKDTDKSPSFLNVPPKPNQSGIPQLLEIRVKE